MALGIGIITYNRQRDLIRTAGSVIFHTKDPYYLVVADDGSTDDTRDHMSVGGVSVITGKNRGVCWNKNRALYALMTYTDADPIILLEDDCYPEKAGWDREWTKAAELHHHVNFQHDNWPKTWCVGGEGTAANPWLTWEITGQATITTRAALRKVGYLNIEFKGYGYGHIEWSERFCHAGFLDRSCMPCMKGGLVMEEGRTFRKQEDVARNKRLADKLRLNPVNCLAACTVEDAEALEFETGHLRFSKIALRSW